MKFKALGNIITKHLQNNLWLYIFSTLCLCTGIVLGVYSVKYMDDTQKNDLLKYFTNITTSQNIKSENYYQVFFQTLKNNLPILIGICFLGLTMIGIPIILIIDLLKGYTIGFTITFLINGLGLKGVWIALLSVIPQNIIYIPCILVASVLSMKFSMMLIKDNEKRHWTTGLASHLFSYFAFFFIIVSFMFLGFSFETYVTPMIIKLIV